MHSTKKILLPGLIGAMALPLHAADFLVGQGPGCQFNTIQAAVNAAAANPGADTVRIANSGTYFAEAVTIGAQDLIVDGDYAACADTTPSGTDATISGLGGAAAPVFSITGTGIRRFQNLAIVRGDQTATGEGGGINFDGSGELILSNIGLSFNRAGFGGAINFRGAGGEAVLTLLSGTVLQLNEAITGGGGAIRTEGAAQVFMQEPRILIASNSALLGSGGGLLLLDDSFAIISSEGFGNGVITSNSARDGGGIALEANSADDLSKLLMYTTNPAAPVSLRNNIASSKGGAIYVNPYADNTDPFGEVLPVCLNSFHLSGNRAQEGAAIYSGSGFAIGLAIESNTFLNAGLCGLQATGAVPCTRGQNSCNTIEGHVNETTAGIATTGATVLLQDLGRLRTNDVIFSNNRGGSVLRTIEQEELQLRNAAMIGNVVTGPLIRVNSWSGDEATLIQHATLAGNSIGGTQVVQFEDGPTVLKFNHNLIFQPGKVSVTLPFAISNNGPTNWDYNATSDTIQILPLPWQSINIDPRFIDSMRGNYRLRVGSRLVDRYPNVPAVPAVLDLDGRARPIKLSIIPGSDAVDVGAYERQVADPWLLNGNFDGNLNYWPSDNPGLTSFSTLNLPGNPGGSIAFARAATVGATVPAYNAGVQCFNVPGPGVYRLSGAGRGSVTIFSDGDSPYIFWRVRSNSADCVQAAPVALEGNLLLPNQSAFAQVATPAEIVIPAGIWTPNTTIELRLDVRVTPVDGAIRAGFDNIQITGMSTDRLFANGFE
jgi:predicted outer membrane repeat protein